MDERVTARWRLTRKLYELGWDKQKILEALRLLTWMMRLPEADYLILRERMVTYEKENPMTTTLLDFEEYALKRGRQEGLQEGLQEGIQRILRHHLEIGQKGMVMQWLRTESCRGWDHIFAGSSCLRHHCAEKLQRIPAVRGGRDVVGVPYFGVSSHGNGMNFFAVSALDRIFAMFSGQGTD